MTDTNNPLIKVVVRAEERDRDKEFVPENELGVSEEHLLEFIAETVAEVVQSRAAQGKGLELDDLGYLVLMGLMTGVEFERDRDES